MFYELGCLVGRLTDEWAAGFDLLSHRRITFFIWRRIITLFNGAAIQQPHTALRAALLAFNMLSTFLTICSIFA